MDIALCDSGEDIQRLAEAALRSGTRIVAAGGGDGTISTVGAALAGTDAALGVLPLGTLNHFARDLGIPLELEAAAGNLLAGRVVRVDVGEVNGRVFLNNSSLGLYPRVLRQREITRERLGWGKWPAFVWASLIMLRRYPLLEVCLHTGGTKIRRRTPFVFVGNNEYRIEGFDLGARNRLDGGRLSVYITRDVGRLGLLRLAIRALTRRLRDEKDFDALFVEEVSIETPHRRLRVSTDGEVTLMSSPFRYRVRRGALQVVVPLAGAS